MGEWDSDVPVNLKLSIQMGRQFPVAENWHLNSSMLKG
jgi:hypothetical protein